MRTLSRWDPDARHYEDCGVPDEWRVSVYEADMDAPVDCAGCGHSLPFGESYTSLQIHVLPTGFGYAVCPICHEAELKRELRAREHDKGEEGSGEAA